jgi:FkbM family methyltransferase
VKVIEVWSPKGHRADLVYRDDTSDLSTIGSTWNLWGKLEDEYGLGSLPDMAGLAVDIGAHIGSIAFALLADHPDLSVVAVEPLQDNCEVMAATARMNGWESRIDIRHAAIGPGKEAKIGYDFEGDANLRNHRYIGGMTLGTDNTHKLETVPTVSLSAILKGVDSSPFLKVDCEGCEWTLLADKAIKKVEYIVGEGHPNDWVERVHKALDKSHAVAILTDFGGPGTFSATIR